MQINDDWAGGRQASSNGAAQTGIVSVAGIRLDPGKFVRPFKGIFCDDFLSSSPTNSASQSGLCEPRTVSVGHSRAQRKAPRTGRATDGGQVSSNQCEPHHTRNANVVLD